SILGYPTSRASRWESSILSARAALLLLAGVAPTQMAGEKTFDGAHINDPILGLIDAMPLVGKQQILDVVIAGPQRIDDPVGMIALDAHVIGALNDEQWRSDVAGMVEG